MTTREQAVAARAASRAVQRLPSEARLAALERMAVALTENAQAICEANARDIDEAKAAVETGSMDANLLGRLRITEERLDVLATGDRDVADADFFDSALTTVLAEDELLTEVKLPALPPRATAPSSASA